MDANLYLSSCSIPEGIFSTPLPVRLHCRTTPRPLQTVHFPCRQYPPRFPVLPVPALPCSRADTRCLLDVSLVLEDVALLHPSFHPSIRNRGRLSFCLPKTLGYTTVNSSNHWGRGKPLQPNQELLVGDTVEGPLAGCFVHRLRTGASPSKATVLLTEGCCGVHFTWLPSHPQTASHRKYLPKVHFRKLLRSRWELIKWLNACYTTNCIVPFHCWAWKGSAHLLALPGALYRFQILPGGGLDWLFQGCDPHLLD